MIKYNIGDVVDAKIGKIIIDDIALEKQKDGKNKTTYYCHCEKGHHFKRYGYAMNSCPICSGRIIVKGFNDISARNPELFDMLLDKEFGYTHAPHSNKKTDWICPTCDSIVNNVSPNQVLRQGLPCKKCSDGVSYGEKYILNLLELCGIKYIKEYSKTHADWCGEYRYDFYLPKYDWIIEVHGIQHYEDAWDKKDIVIANDINKKNLATQHVQNYVVIDARKSEKHLLKKSVLYSDLYYIIDPLYIEWTKVHTNSLRSNIKKAASMYNNDVLIKDIADSLSVSISTVHNYLVSASDVGLCNYNVEESKLKSYDFFKNNLTQINSKPILCVENGFVFSSSKKCDELSLDLLGKHLSSSNIRKVLNGERNHTGNYTFQYITRSDFNRIKTEEPDKAFGNFFSE